MPEDEPTRCRRCGESAHRYSPDHPQHGPQGRWDWQACINSLLARAERAERERDALRADNDRLREALIDLADFAEESGTSCLCDGQGMCSLCVARAALSAEPEAPSLGNIIGYRGPSRAEAFGPDHVEFCHCGRAEPCRHHEVAEGEPARAGGDCPCGPAYVSPICKQHAEGGRSDASVDGGGDDGRSRAMHAMWEGTAQRRGVSWDTLQLLLADALDSGGVVTYGAYEAVEDAAMDNRHRVERTEATNRELEAALRGVLAAIEDIDQAAWLLTMAVGNGDAGWLDNAVADVQKRHDLAYVGPSSPVSRARAALEGSEEASHA